MKNGQVGDEFRLQAVGERHDDRENHRRRADDCRSDQNRLRRCLEGISGAVILLEEMLCSAELRVEPVVVPELLLNSRLLLDERELENRLCVVGDRAVRIDCDRHWPHSQESERDQAKSEYSRRDHQSSEALGAHQESDGHQNHDR